MRPGARGRSLALHDRNQFVVMTGGQLRQRLAPSRAPGDAGTVAVARGKYVLSDLAEDHPAVLGERQRSAPGVREADFGDLRESGLEGSLMA